MKNNLIIYLLISFLLFSCNIEKDGQSEQKETLEETIVCDLDSIEKVILQLPEVVKRENFLSAEGKGHVSFLRSEKEIKGKKYFEINVGFNNPERRETYFNFFINPIECNEIKVLEPVEGEIISLENWRKRENSSSDNSIYCLFKDKKESILPFNFKIFYDLCTVKNLKPKCDSLYSRYAINEDCINWMNRSEGEAIPADYFILPTQKNLSAIIAWYDADVEQYELITFLDNKKVSKYTIGRMDGEEILSFNVLTFEEIQLFKQKDSKDSLKPFKKIKILNNGIIKEQE